MACAASGAIAHRAVDGTGVVSHQCCDDVSVPPPPPPPHQGVAAAVRRKYFFVTAPMEQRAAAKSQFGMAQVSFASPGIPPPATGTTGGGIIGGSNEH